MTPFAIGGLQLNVSGLRDNLPYMEAKLDYFMYLFPWVQMVVFSELAAYGPNPAKAEPLPGPAERMFQEMAARHHIWMINGSLIELALLAAVITVTSARLAERWWPRARSGYMHRGSHCPPG